MIVFIDYIYKGIGGVGQIVVNTTIQMNKMGYSPKLYCSKSSFEYQRLIEQNAYFEHIDSDVISIKLLKNFISADDVLFLTNIGVSSLLYYLRRGANKLLFYCVHPDTFFPFSTKSWLPFHQERTLKFISTLNNNNALFLMDRPNLDAISKRGGRLNKIHYWPVPVEKTSVKSSPQCACHKYRITYLGRGNDIWKVYPVIKILEDLNGFNHSFQLDIITDVNDLFIQMINEYIPHNRVPINYLNGYYGEKLYNYLAENSYLHISMGTAALDGAKLGIPTVLIDYSKHPFPNDYLYRWIYEMEDYCLANEITEDYSPITGASLSQILSELKDVKNYRQVSERCIEYVEKNHSIEQFVEGVIDASEKTTMTTQMYCETGFFRNMYYIKPVIDILSKTKNSLWHIITFTKTKEF